MRKQNFDIVGQQIVTKFLEKETKKKKKKAFTCSDLKDIFN